YFAPESWHVAPFLRTGPFLGKKSTTTFLRLKRAITFLNRETANSHAGAGIFAFLGRPRGALLSCSVTTTNEAMMIEQFLKPWKVTAIDVLPEDAGVEITFRTEGRDPVRFRTESMGLKGRAKAAALAKFS